MFVPAVSVAFFAFFAGAQAAPGLKVALSLPDAAERAAAGRLPIIEADVINTGDVDLYVLPYNTLLQKGAPTADFIITGEVAAPSFHGVRVSSSVALGSDPWSNDAFAQVNPARDVHMLKDSGLLVHLKPGQSKSVKATLTKRYDFDNSGAGEYQLTVPKTFHVLTPDHKNEFSTLDAEVNTVSFHYTPGLVRSRKRSTEAVAEWWVPSGPAGDFIDDATYEKVGAGALHQTSAKAACNVNYIRGAAGISKQALATSLK